MTAERVCAYIPCSRPLERKEREKPSQFATRTHCDTNCAARHASGSTINHDSPDRQCMCGGVLRRRENESHARFATRKFCSPSCASRNADRKAPRKQKVRRPVESKTCDQCGGRMQRRASEGVVKWRGRRACSVGCGAKLRRTKEQTDRAAAAVGRMCAYPVCGQLLVQKETEPPSQFAARRFCGRSCARAHQNTRCRDSPAQTRTCEGCPTVMVWDRDRMQAYQWRAKRFCSPGCASRSRIRVEPKVVPSKDRARKQAPVAPAPVPVARPRPEALVPDPDVIDMDRKRRAAMLLFDDGVLPRDVATHLGVSLAQANRWDRGDR